MRAYNCLLIKEACSTKFEIIAREKYNKRFKDKWWVIDIGGNNLRLLAAILFTTQKVFVKHIVTHPEYDKLTQRYKKGEL